MQIVLLAEGTNARAARNPEPLLDSLVPVNGRPFIDWQLDCFVASGARQLVLCVGAGGEQIEAHVRRALDRGLSVAYSYAGEQQLGSGGALRRAYARLQDEFVVTYGGRYLPFDYAAPLADLRAHPRATATLAVSHHPGGVELDGDWVSRCDAAGAPFTEFGALALRRSALASIEDGAVWGIEALLRNLAKQQKLRAFVAPERGYDVGSPELERHLASQPAAP